VALFIEGSESIGVRSGNFAASVPETLRFKVGIARPTPMDSSSGKWSAREWRAIELEQSTALEDAADDGCGSLTPRAAQNLGAFKSLACHAETESSNRFGST
jgi:hypothetical protein